MHSQNKEFEELDKLSRCSCMIPYGKGHILGEEFPDPTGSTDPAADQQIHRSYRRSQSGAALLEQLWLAVTNMQTPLVNSQFAFENGPVERI